MITIIVGTPGAGKTAKLTHFIYEKIISDSFSDLHEARKELSKLSCGGFQNIELPPQRHLVYADYPVKIGRRISAYYVDGFSIGMPNPFFKTTLLPPYSTIFLDEAQRYYNSRMSRYLREEVYLWYQLHRHNHYHVFMACQRLANIDINIRSLAERIIVIDSIECHESEWGFVDHIEWKGRQFSSPDSAETYCLAKESGKNCEMGQPYYCETDVCVFDFYDSYGNKPMFYNQIYAQGFDYYTDEGYAFTLDSFIEFNNRHYYSAPAGFWKSPEFDKRILAKKE